MSKSYKELHKDAVELIMSIGKDMAEDIKHRDSPTMDAKDKEIADLKEENERLREALGISQAVMHACDMSMKARGMTEFSVSTTNFGRQTLDMAMEAAHAALEGKTVTKLEALKELLAKVEAESSQWSGQQVQNAFGMHVQKHFHGAMNGSLDAAKALHEAVLPEWRWYKMDIVDGAGHRVGIVDRKNLGQPFYADHFENPARAWLIAILRALIAKEQEA